MQRRTRLMTLAAGAALTVAPIAMPAGVEAKATPDFRKVPNVELTGTLRSVAVISGRDTWAVGDEYRAQDGRYALAEHWDGQKWSRVPIPGSDENGHGEFRDVSGVSPDDVWTVGDTSGQGPMLRRWDGKAWTKVAPEPPPNNEPLGSNSMYGIAAVSKNDAWAVGSYSGDWSKPMETLVQRWNGTKWARVPSPNPGAQSRTLRAVSASSAGNVWAVGWYTDADGRALTMALRWNGTAWKNTALPLPPGHVQLQGVTAVSRTEVWAVGANEGKPVAFRWNGQRWNRLPRVQGLPAHNGLNTVVPDGRGGMWAAGFEHNSEEGTNYPLYLHWNGRSWRKATNEEKEGEVHALARSGASTWAVGTTSPHPAFTAPPLLEVNGALPTAG